MKRIRLSDLEAHFAECLRDVQEGHEILTVLDQGDRPMARIVPVASDREDLWIRAPRADAPALRDVALPPPLEFDGDIVDFLLEERQGGR